MKGETLILIGAALVLMAGCAAKRQTAVRVDYVPAPPAKAAVATADQAQVVVIEEPRPAPAPPEPAPPAQSAQETTPATPAPAPARHRAATAAANPGSTQEPAEATEPEVPQLAPGETSASQSAALRRQIDEVRSRMGTYDRARLSAGALKALDDASNFVGQSKQALDTGDLVRSSNLLHKALLLMEVVEKQR